jgi:hypothetical protein
VKFLLECDMLFLLYFITLALVKTRMYFSRKKRKECLKKILLEKNITFFSRSGHFQKKETKRFLHWDTNLFIF